jgi:hypothetical protein
MCAIFFARKGYAANAKYENLLCVARARHPLNEPRGRLNMHNKIAKVEHECNICGDHKMLNPAILYICHGCDNGIMFVVKRVDHD